MCRFFLIYYRQKKLTCRKFMYFIKKCNKNFYWTSSRISIGCPLESTGCPVELLYRTSPRAEDLAHSLSCFKFFLKKITVLRGSTSSRPKLTASAARAEPLCEYMSGKDFKILQMMMTEEMSEAHITTLANLCDKLRMKFPTSNQHGGRSYN